MASRMMKKSASFVLASLRGSTYRKGTRRLFARCGRAGTRRVLARQGWAGKKVAFLNILQAIQAPLPYVRSQRHIWQLPSFSAAC
jgi:hypothetical protein